MNVIEAASREGCLGWDRRCCNFLMSRQARRPAASPSACGRGGGRPCSGSAASAPTCAPPRPRRSTAGPSAPAAPACASIIPGTASRAALFEEGTLSRWLDDTLAVIDGFAAGPLVLVGSSMGAWLALLATRELLKRKAAAHAAGLVLIAPAVDFTERLMWDRFAPAIRQTILQDGVYLRPSAYSPDPYPITRALIEDGRRHLLFGGTIATGCPVHILQGMQDPDVPWSHAMELDRAPARRQRLHDADQGRRSSLVAGRGSATPDRRRRGHCVTPSLLI